MKNESYSANSDLSFYLNKMFQDNPAVSALQLAETKSMYMTVFGLAPHFKSILVQDVQNKPFCLLFDESLNKSTTTKQLDVHVRFWRDNFVTTRYLDSIMLGRATAEHLVSSIKTLNGALNFSNMFQISMDGPNVNWAAYDVLTRQLKNDYGHELVNIGSCGLHQIHNAFRAGSNATPWHVDTFLFSLHRLFKDVPARRAEYISATNSDIFPLKFAPHRWIENQRVLLRAQDMIKHLDCYVRAVSDKKVSNPPKCQSYENVVSFLKDPLLEAKIVFMVKMCKPLETFLTLYQRDCPMVPFLFKDLEDLLVKIMKKFIKPSAIDIEVNVKASENCLPLKNLKIGIETLEKVKKSKCSPKDELNFSSDCLTFCQSIVSKLQEKSPLKYSFTKYLQSLSPQFINSSQTNASKYFKQALLHLKNLGWLNIQELDDIHDQYENLIEHADAREIFQSFDHRADVSVENIFHQLCASNENYAKLWPVLEKLLVISHGQASVERGFSANKQALQVNMQKETLVGRRIVKDHIRAIGGVENFKVTKDLMMSCSLARARYENSLQSKRADVIETVRGKKRKALELEISEMKKRKVLFEKTIAKLQEESDASGELAEAEKKMEKKLVLFSKSAALRQSVKTKEAEVKEIEKSLIEKQALLKAF